MLDHNKISAVRSLRGMLARPPLLLLTQLSSRAETNTCEYSLRILVLR